MNGIGLFWFLILALALFLLYKVAMRAISKGIEGKNYSIDVLNGIKLLLRFLFIFVLAFEFFNMIGINPEILISVSSISGIIIGFASTEVVGQIVSGIYLITAQPFGVHDLVNIDGTEGIVISIGFNYVIIQKFNGSLVKIPNKRILDSKIKNYTLKMTDELKKRQENLPDDEKIQLTKENLRDGSILDVENIKEVFGTLSDFVTEDEVTRYVFDIEVDLGIDPYTAIERLDNVCDTYKAIFNYRPKCFLVELGYRAKFRFRIYCTNPRTIINYYNNFLEDVTYELYENVEDK